MEKPKNKWLVAPVIFLCSVFVCAPVADAALITLFGNNVTFTLDDSTSGFFGTPKVQGDTLYLLPT